MQINRIWRPIASIWRGRGSAVRSARSRFSDRAFLSGGSVSVAFVGRKTTPERPS